MLFEEVLTYLDELRAKDAAPGSKRRSFPIESHTSHVASRWLLLLMLHESQGQPPDMYENPENNGDKLPTSTGAGFLPSTVLLFYQFFDW